MIKSVQFRNFKVLQNTVLPLGRLTLIVGANGSGKSTAMQALHAAASPNAYPFHLIATAGLQPIETATVEVSLHWGGVHADVTTIVRWGPGGNSPVAYRKPDVGEVSGGIEEALFGSQTLYRVSCCSLNGLRTDRYKCNDYGCNTRKHKYPPANIYPVCKIG